MNRIFYRKKTPFIVKPLNLSEASRLVFSLLLIGLTACAHPISQQMLAQIDPDLSLNQLLETLDPHIDKNVMFGGVIVNTRSYEDRTEVEVIQKELDFLGYPSREDETDGRFIFVKDGFLEPEIYAKGRYVTGAGKLTGTRTGKIDNKEYNYPLIEVAELKLWKNYNYSPYYRPFYGPYYGPFYRPYFFYGFGRLRHFGYGGFYGY